MSEVAFIFLIISNINIYVLKYVVLYLLVYKVKQIPTKYIRINYVIFLYCIKYVQ